MARPRPWHNQLEMATILLVLLVMMMQLKPGMSDINKDKEECASQLAGLATCLPYVGGQSKAPTPDCCTGLKQVIKESMKCLCILIKDRNDPSLGLKINTTLAVTIPQTCHAPANVAQCPALLHLAPNDPDVKVFSGFANASATATTTPPTSTATSTGGSSSSGKLTSDGGKGKVRWATASIFYGVLLSSFAASISPHLIS